MLHFAHFGSKFGLKFGSRGKKNTSFSTFCPHLGCSLAHSGGKTHFVHILSTFLMKFGSRRKQNVSFSPFCVHIWAVVWLTMEGKCFVFHIWGPKLG